MNEILNNICKRRSVRRYKTTAVDKATIEQILDAGRMAPSAVNMQPWRFYVLTNPERIKSIAKEIAVAAESYFYLSHGVHIGQTEDAVFHGAPLVIFVSSKASEWAQLDIGMCAQNMMLAAKSLGLDSCPVGFGKFVEKTKSYSSLEVPSSEHIVISLVFGYGDEQPKIIPRVRDNVVYLS